MNQIELTAEDKRMFAVRFTRMQAYQQLAQAEQADMYRILQQEYHLPEGEQWEMDVEKGVLYRAATTEQPQ